MKRFAAIVCALLIGTAAHAAVTTYTSEAAFLSALTGPNGTEDFEGFATIPGPLGGPDILGLTFNYGTVNTGTASYLSAGPTAGMNPDGFISDWFYETNYVRADNVAAGSLTFDFSAPISAIGFTLLDAGDVGPGDSLFNPDNYELILDNGTTVTINTVGNANRSVQYFGLIDDMSSFSSVTIDNQFVADIFGVDDVTVQNFVMSSGPPMPPPPPPGGGGNGGGGGNNGGGGGQPPTAVPEPASFAVWGALMLVGLGYRFRKQN